MLSYRYILLFFLVIVHILSKGQWTIQDDKYNSGNLVVNLVETMLADSDQAVVGNQENKALNQRIPDEYLNLIEELNPLVLLKNEALSIENSVKDLMGIPSLKMDSNQLNNLFGVNGSVTSEFYTSNFRVPFNLNEQTYLRVQGNPSLEVGSLPFVMDFYYTTEDNTYLNANALSFRLDVTQFKKNLLNKKEAKINDGKDLLKDLYSYEEKLELYKQDIERVKNQLENELNAKLDRQKERYSKEKLESELNQRKIAVQNQFIDSIHRYKNSGLSHLNKAKDSLSMTRDEFQVKGSQVTDSIENVQKQILEVLNEYLGKVDSMQAKLAKCKELYSRFSSDPSSAAKSQVLESLETNDSLRVRREKVFEKRKRLENWIQNVDNFEVGLFTPFFSENSLNGVPVQGIYYEQTTDSIPSFTSFAAGLMANELNSFSINRGDPSNLFSRRMVATKQGFGSQFGNNAYILSMYSWDGMNNQNDQSIRNGVNGLGLQYTFRKLTLIAEGLHSFYQELGSLEQLSDETLRGNSSFTDRLSFDAELLLNLHQNTQLRGLIDQKGFAFRTVGSPFLQNDYRMLEVHLQQSLFKQKVVASAFQKSFVDNLSGLNEIDNSMRGMGITVQSNFQKGFNFFATYTPFEQSNQHVDSIQRTNNRFQSLSAQASYQKSWDKHLLYSSLNYNNAVVEYQESKFTKALTHTWSLIQMYQNDKWNVSSTYVLNLTNPSIDSLNFHSLNANVRYTHKSLTLQFQSQNKRTFNQGTHLRSSLNTGYFWRKLRLRSFVEVGGGYLDGIWGVSHQGYYFSSVRLEWLLK
jgi:hypothetical protein